MATGWNPDAGKCSDQSSIGVMTSAKKESKLWRGVSLPDYNNTKKLYGECKMQESDFDSFTNDELARAIELMVTPEELRSRQIMIAILKAADFTAREVKDQIFCGETLFDGPSVSWTF